MAKEDKKEEDKAEDPYLMHSHINGGIQLVNSDLFTKSTHLG